MGRNAFVLTCCLLWVGLPTAFIQAAAAAAEEEEEEEGGSGPLPNHLCKLSALALEKAAQVVLSLSSFSIKKEEEEEEEEEAVLLKERSKFHALTMKSPGSSLVSSRILLGTSHPPTHPPAYA